METSSITKKFVISGKVIGNISGGLAIVTAVLMIFSLSACGKKSGAETKSLYAQGMEIVQLMSEMAQSEEFMDLYTGSNNLKTIIQDISTGDHSSPKAVYAISIADADLAAMAELSGMDNASGELKNFLMQRVFGSMMTQINGMGGVESLAASSICTVGKTFVNENAAENVIYLYTYENAIPVAVTFTIGENQAVSASGVFVMYDGFTCGSADEIRSFFSYVNVDVSEVLPEK